ncbi:putative F-box domain-containing protein [Helianthus annuus]|uniref:F-box domain-containing protein n=1 Tax=Helianthus annuus TaxID=4232 RepID=A0A251RN25_HELAN|nr:F-box/kelch-repeat protein At3g06240 [Helianthus annuus]KAF5754475.1 putative F-box domain-containing protein [Helianthus annuus]KAJ0428377.1 putative F-box domain-containing protein [Helianthus annuus]KAJ0446697.1 putative F-box domain-containing protein [Helianthus annuus]KAJ0629811.1 putative F-box domain-containing protein [Helianthus annuus]KAJ0631604.1 putative F-box domain-containing protein [Helianthus annuus]
MSDLFPHDLQLQILKRLPLNSLLKFRTVSKSWNSLITSNHFISSHLQSITHNNPQSLFIRYFDRTRKIEQYITAKDDQTFGIHFSNIDFQHASKTAYFRIVGCCNGVVCLSDDLFDSMCMVVLWNPSIRKSVRVLVPDYQQNCVWPRFTVLGFGVCPVTHDPKVVKIVFVNAFSVPDQITVEDPPLVEVFSVNSGGWGKPFGQNRNRPCNKINITWSQVCFNGAIHWVAYDRRIEASGRCIIVSFDLVHEVFDEMPLPDALASQDIGNLAMSSRKGQLTMLEYDMEKGKEACGVWVMKEYGVPGSWEEMYVIRLPGMLRRVVGFRTNGDMVLALKNHELVYVECTGNVKSLGIYANIRSFFVGSYMESLILINQLDQ